MTRVKLSIIVPVLNEADGIPGLIEHLLPLRHEGAELLLVDGASTDTTVSLAGGAGLPVIRAERGRARQMNAGAAQACGDSLLFLHADTRLPDQALQLIGSCLEGARCWGRFDVRISGRPALLKLVAALMNLRSRWTGVATGDQAMFMTRRAFDAVGGFPEQPLMEDVEMSKRLRRLSRPVCIQARATTSGRRWESRGVWRTILLMWRLRWAYWRGVPASRLAEAYR